jgi:hypothetical protein
MVKVLATYLYNVQCMECGSTYQRLLSHVRNRKLTECTCITPAGYNHRLQTALKNAKPCKYCGESLEFDHRMLPAPLKLKGGLCKECRNFLNDEERRDIPKFESHHRRYKLMWQQYLGANQSQPICLQLFGRQYLHNRLIRCSWGH